HMSAVYTRSEDRSHGLEGGADAYLIKPVDPHELVATVRALLRIRKAEEERTRLLQERAELADHLRLLLESTGEGIYGLDRERRCTFINRAAAAMLGYTPEQLVGQPAHDLIHHRQPDGSTYPAADCPILRAMRTGEGCRVDREVFWRRDGTSFPVA